MATVTEVKRDLPRLQMHREAKATAPNTESGKSLGEEALEDALKIVIGCWVLLALLVFSLRHHII